MKFFLICFFLIYLNFPSLLSQNNIKNTFVSMMMSSYRDNCEKTIREIVVECLESENITFSSEYSFVPLFDLEFRRLTFNEKKLFNKYEKLKNIYYSDLKYLLKDDTLVYKHIDTTLKKNYLSYIDTKKMKLNEIWIFKSDVFYGKIIKYGSLNGEKMFYSFTKLYDVIELYKDVPKYSPTIMFRVVKPSSNLYFISNEDIMVISNIKKEIITFDSYILTDEFDFSKPYLKSHTIKVKR